MRIYDAATGGNQLWQEIQTIFIKAGIFNLVLGSSTPINLPFDKDYWLGTKVGADSEMTPRQQLVSGAYSFMADQAGTATYALTAGVAPGTATYSYYTGTATLALNADKLTGKTPSELTVGTATWSATATYAERAGAHYIGELYGGGIVFWVDHTGQHGLITSLVNITTSSVWSNVSTLIGPTAQSTWNGQANSTAIMGQTGHTNSAAKWCDNYTNTDYGTGIYSDWYLPARDELSLIYHTLYILNKNIEGVGGASIFALDYYWSSTEYNSYDAWYQHFINGDQNGTNKFKTFYVRAVRAF